MAPYYGMFFVFVFIWVLRPVKTFSLILSGVNLKVGRNREIPEKKKNPDHPQA